MKSRKREEILITIVPSKHKKQGKALKKLLHDSLLLITSKKIPLAKVKSEE